MPYPPLLIIVRRVAVTSNCGPINESGPLFVEDALLAGGQRKIEGPVFVIHNRRLHGVLLVGGLGFHGRG